MKPILLKSIDDYPKSGLGRITTATNQKVHEVLNGDYNFTFDMLVTDRLYSKIDDEMIVATSVSVEDTDFFYIQNIDIKNPGTITVTCNHITMLTNENYVRGKLTIDNKSVSTVISDMTKMLDLPGQKFTYETDINQTIGKTDIVFTNSNPSEILMGDTNSLVHVLDARLVRKGTVLKLTKKNTGHLIDLRYGKNISGVSVNRNTNSLVTSIVPYFNMKSKEVKNTEPDNTPTDPNGWTVKSVDGKVTVGINVARIYDDQNSLVGNYSLAPKTEWKTDRQRTKSGVTQYRVATNMWLLSQSVTLDGNIGEVIAKPQATVKPSDTVPEDQLQYGPEVYSPQFSKHALPHRKYVDYSSRVDNIPDLIDLSSHYFIENPLIDKPTYIINIDVVNANQKRVVNAQIGDTARIFDPKYGIESEETIIEREFNPDMMTNTSVKAGTYQQTIFRYLDKRIQDNNQKTTAYQKQNNDNINQTNDDIKQTNKDLDAAKKASKEAEDKLNDDIYEAEKKAQEMVQKVKEDVQEAQNSITNFMNSGGSNIIRWIPTLAEATQMEINTDSGYLLIDDHGMAFHKKDGTVITGMSADGRFYADSIVGNSLTGTTITGGTITGGYINGAKMTAGSIEGAIFIRLNNNGKVTTSIADYGISTPSLTVHQIDGLKSMTMGPGSFISINGAELTGDGNGNLYVDGKKVKTE